MIQYSGYGDDDLLTAIQNSDEQAFQELFNRYWFRLLNYAAKKLPTDIYAEEVVQDLFIHLWQTRHSVCIENISNYLHSGVRYRCISAYRTLLNKKKYWDHYKWSIPANEGSVESDFINKEKYTELERVIAKLPAMAQKIVRMKVMEALTLQDISLQLNCSKKTVEYHLAKSLKVLKSRFQEFLIIITFIFC